MAYRWLHFSGSTVFFFFFFAVDNKNDDLCEQAAMALETSTVVCCVSGQLQPLKVKHAIINSSK